MRFKSIDTILAPIKSKALASMDDFVQKIPQYFPSIQEKHPSSHACDSKELGREKSMHSQL